MGRKEGERKERILKKRTGGGQKPTVYRPRQEVVGRRGETKDGVPAGRLIGHRWFVGIIWGSDHMRYSCTVCISKAIRSSLECFVHFHFHMRLVMSHSRPFKGWGAEGRGP